MGDGGGLAAYNDCRQGTRMRRMQMADVSSGHGDTLLTEAMQRSADKFPFEAPTGMAATQSGRLVRLDQDKRRYGTRAWSTLGWLQRVGMDARRARHKGKRRTRAVTRGRPSNIQA